MAKSMLDDILNEDLKPRRDEASNFRLDEQGRHVITNESKHKQMPVDSRGRIQMYPNARAEKEAVWAAEREAAEAKKRLKESKAKNQSESST